MRVKPMPGRRPIRRVLKSINTNRSLEELMVELAKHGLPTTGLYMDKGSDGNFKKGLPVTGTKWWCMIRTPHDLNDRNPYLEKGVPGGKDYQDTHMTPEGFQGEGLDLKTAVYMCLKRVEFYYEHGWHYQWPVHLKPKDVPDYSDISGVK